LLFVVQLGIKPSIFQLKLLCTTFVIKMVPFLLTFFVDNFATVPTLVIFLHSEMHSKEFDHHIASHS